MAACGGGGGGDSPAPASVADLSVSAEGPAAPLMSGGTATYTMTVTNAGPDAASNVVIENVTDGKQTLGAVACVAGGGAVCPQAPGLRMTAPLVPRGGTLTFTVFTRIAAAAEGTVSHTMRVRAGDDPVPANDVATATATTAVPALTGAQTVVLLQSDWQDPVGHGFRYAHTQANDVFTVQATGRFLSLRIEGDDPWTANFAVPATLTQFEVGTYAVDNDYSVGSGGLAGMAWTGSTTCNFYRGSFTVDQASYVGGNLVSLDLHFEQHCNGAVPALRGQFHWVATDRTAPSGPVEPAPDGLWRAPDGDVPATGNYVHVSIDAGSVFGAARKAVYTQANAVIDVFESSGNLQATVNGDESWNGSFQAMVGLAQLQPGLYLHLPMLSGIPARGHLNWFGTLGSCGTMSTGWVVVDRVEHDTMGVLAAIDLRFEQRCADSPGALRGQIHWRADDTTAPPGPQVPPPVGLWEPAAGATPGSGNYVYLQSEAGDYVGQGATYLYTADSATISVATGPASTGRGLNVMVSVSPVSNWVGQAASMIPLAQWVPGYYPFVPITSPNLAKARFAWGGMGRGCPASGWFVIDSIAFLPNGNVASIDIRFEQHCDGATPVLRGKVHLVN